MSSMVECWLCPFCFVKQYASFSLNAEGSWLTDTTYGLHNCIYIECMVVLYGITFVLTNGDVRRSGNVVLLPEGELVCRRHESPFHVVSDGRSEKYGCLRIPCMDCPNKVYTYVKDVPKYFDVLGERMIGDNMYYKIKE